MIWKMLMRTLLLCAAWMALEGLAIAQEKVRDDVASQVSTLSLDNLVLRDTFNDNKTASMWNLWSDDANNCWVNEANGRLELRATKQAANAFSGYVAKAWRLDPQHDFSIKVNYHASLKSSAKCWVSLGITPNYDSPRSRRINIDAQCSSLSRTGRYEYVDGYTLDSSVADMASDDGTLYVFYTAADDTLYVSMSGQDPNYAWGAFPGVLQGQWGGQPLHVMAGGGSDGLAVSSGDAYLDNLEVDSGTVVEASLQAVYHFKSIVGDKHFYTMSNGEKEKLLTSGAKSWAYQGAAFYAFPDDSDPGCKPVYRFWSPSLGSHFYTMSEGEKNHLRNGSVWTYEGICFYAYPSGSQPDWSAPVYRFWSKTYGAHLYTADEDQKDDLIAKYSKVWTYEGVCWYAIE
jgi:hypothetical protein